MNLRGHHAGACGFRALGLVVAIAVWMASASVAGAAPVRIGLPVASLDFLAVYVAEDRGFFAQRGLEPEVTVLRGGAGVTQALVAGDIDVGMVGPVEVTVLKKRGVDARLVMTTTDIIPMSLIARTVLNIDTVAGLRGKAIGVTSPGSLSYGLARYFLARHGLNPDRDVTLVPLGIGPEMMGAIKSGRVDALMIFEPFVSMLVTDGTARVILDVPKELRAFPSNNVVALQASLQKNPDLFRRYAESIRDALRYMRTDREGTRAIVEKRFSGMPPAVLRAALERYFRFYSADGTISREALAEAQDVLVKAGLLDRPYPYEEMMATLPR